jgi:hypothetical protein
MASSSCNRYEAGAGSFEDREMKVSEEILRFFKLIFKKVFFNSHQGNFGSTG